MTALPILNLSLPKSTRYTCEICGLPARFTCKETPVAFCTLDHFHQDWKGIRHLIVEETKELRSLTVTNATKTKVRSISLAESRKFLVQGDFASAVAAALQSLKISVSLEETPDNLLIAPCYLLLAEGNIGLARLKDAENFLSLAQNNLANKNSLCLMSQLQRNFGKLFSMQAKHFQALKAFASDVYYCTRNFGANSFETAPAFFNLGRVFLMIGNFAAATRCFEKTLEIFLLHGRGRVRIEVQEALSIVKEITDKDLKADVEAALFGLTGQEEHKELALLLLTEAGLSPDHHKIERLRNM